MLNICSKRIYSTHFMQLFHPKEEQGQFRGYCACSYGGQCKQLRLQEAAGEVCCHMSLTRRRLSLPAGRLLLCEGRASWWSASDCRSCGSWKAPPGPEIQRQRLKLTKQLRKAKMVSCHLVRGGKLQPCHNPGLGKQKRWWMNEKKTKT